jgi:predicted transposase/invertase (TIGR01784 family)
MEVNNPHDKYFKSVFSRKVEAIDLISNSLDKTIVSNIDFSSLSLENTSYIDEYLQESFCDLVFNCKLQNTEVKITILLEHKSFVPRIPHLQLLKYLTNIWIKQNLDNKRSKLGRIIPIIIYHGKQQWKQKSFEDSFPNNTGFLKNLTPNFDYSLINLNDISDMELQEKYKQAITKTSLLLMKNNFAKELLKQNLFSYLRNLKGHVNQRTYSFIEYTTIYIMTTSNIKKNIIVDNFSTISKKGGNVAMTTADKLRMEGRIEGQLEGRLEGRLEGKLEGEIEGRLLERRELLRKQILNNYTNNQFDIPTISNILGVEESYIEKVLIDEGVIED